MLFKKENNVNNAEIREYIPVNISVNFDTISPYISLAEKKYIIPVIGQATYTELLAYYNSSDSGSGSESSYLGQLLDNAQRAIINLALWHAFPVIVVKISEVGAQRLSTQNYEAPYKYQEQNLREMLKVTGIESLDKTLEYLEENITHFSSYAQSLEFLNSKDLFISNAKQFNENYPVEINYLVYKRMKPVLQTVEDFDILPLIGQDLMTNLKSVILNRNADAYETKAISMIRKAVASFAVARGIGELGININDRMVFIETTLGMPSDDVKRSELSREALSGIVSSAEKRALQYCQYLRDYLHANISHFPEYESFPGYLADQVPGKFDNTNKKIIKM